MRPSENRYPVQTFVVEHSDQLIIEAIQREIKRQGQVSTFSTGCED